jgi:foldase protein PrsA
MNGPTMNNKLNPDPPPSSVVSTDILNREPVANRTRVKHILIGWNALAGNYGGGIDPRAARRSKEDAEAQVESLLGQLKGGADFDVLMQAHSEDSGLAANPDGYEVKPDAELVLEFRRLGLRLQVDEVGVVETSFGFHVMKRVE